MMNDLCKVLNIKYPILQGAMGHITTGEFAATVTNAGGLGVIASAERPIDYIREQYHIAKSKTDGPVGLNLPFKKSLADDIAQFIIDEKVEIVVASAGSPKEYVPEWKKHGIKIVSVLSAPEHAVKMNALGVDVIVAEGMESGGRIGKISTMALVPQIVDISDVPVVAAGGIGDGRGVAAAFALGASGVQIGTRFLFAKECPIHDNYRQALLNARSSDIVVSGRPYRLGAEARIIRNKLYEESIQLEKQGAPDEKYEELFVGALRRTVFDGDVDYGSPMAGSVAGMFNKIETVKEIIDDLVADYNSQPALSKIVPYETK